MSEQAAVSNLTELPVLQGMAPDAREQVAKVFYAVAEDSRYDDGQVLIHEGYLSFDTGFVLYEGAVLVERDGKDAIELTAPVLLGEMSQFSAGDTRTATVRAKGAAKAIDFSWEDLYERAEGDLSADVHDQFRKAIEELVWKRFPYRNIADLALFSKLSAELRDRTCSPLPGITEMIRLETGETLFREGTLCKSIGYILLDGRLKLIRAGKGEKEAQAPDIVGIFPAKSEEPLKWSATCVSTGHAELLKFSWERYVKTLGKRLSKDERTLLVESMKANAGKHFWH